MRFAFVLGICFVAMAAAFGGVLTSLHEGPAVFALLLDEDGIRLAGEYKPFVEQYILPKEGEYIPLMGGEVKFEAEGFELANLKDVERKPYYVRFAFAEAAMEGCIDDGLLLHFNGVQELRLSFTSRETIYTHPYKKEDVSLGRWIYIREEAALLCLPERRFYTEREAERWSPCSGVIVLAGKLQEGEEEGFLISAENGEILLYFAFAKGASELVEKLEAQSQRREVGFEKILAEVKKKWADQTHALIRRVENSTGADFSFVDDKRKAFVERNFMEFLTAKITGDFFVPVYTPEALFSGGDAIPVSLGDVFLLAHYANELGIGEVQVGLAKLLLSNPYPEGGWGKFFSSGERDLISQFLGILGLYIAWQEAGFGNALEEGAELAKQAMRIAEEAGYNEEDGLYYETAVGYPQALLTHTNAFAYAAYSALALMVKEKGEKLTAAKIWQKRQRIKQRLSPICEDKSHGSMFVGAGRRGDAWDKFGYEKSEFIPWYVWVQLIVPEKLDYFPEPVVVRSLLWLYDGGYYGDNARVYAGLGEIMWWDRGKIINKILENCNAKVLKSDIVGEEVSLKYPGVMAERFGGGRVPDLVGALATIHDIVLEQVAPKPLMP